MPGRHPHLRYATALAILLNLVLVAGSATALLEERRMDERQAEVATRNLALVLDHSLSELIARTDQALVTVADAYQDALATGRLDGPALDALAARQRLLLDHVLALRIATAEGEVRHGAGPGGPAGGQPWFQRHREGSAPGLLISPPAPGRGADGAVVLSRRLRGPGGGFAGAVYATVPVEALGRRFAAVELGRRGLVELRDERLQLVARHPAAAPGAAAAPAVPAAMARLVATGRPEGSYVAASGVDGVVREVSFRRLERWPLYVGVGLSRDEALADSRRNLVYVAVLLALSALASAVALRAVRRAWQREHEAAKRLARQEERYRIVADHTADWEYWLSPEGAFLYCSPACQQLTGHAAETFHADPAMLERVLHPDDLPAFREHRELEERQVAGGSLFLRLRPAGGRTRWVRHLCQPMRDAAGAYLGVRGSFKDVTETREHEQELARQRRALEEALARARGLEALLARCPGCGCVHGEATPGELVAQHLADHPEARLAEAPCAACRPGAEVAKG